MKVQRAEHPAILAGHEAARDFFATCFMGPETMAHEMLWVAHVDDRGRCIHLGRYSDDRTGAVDLPVRRIIADAARLGSAGVLLAHNHPSGDATPSNADCTATRTLARAAEALDLTVVDHLVFAEPGQCSSLRRMGLLQPRQPFPQAHVATWRINGDGEGRWVMALGVGIERSRPARAAEQRVKAASLAARGPSFG